MNRRTALKVGAQLGVAGGVALIGGYQLLPPSPSASLDPLDVLARRLYASMDAEQRADACVPYDHPLRQYHNRGVFGGGRDILFGFTRAQRKMLTDLLYAGLSDEGRNRVPEEYFVRWSGVNAMRALICGEPGAGPYQIILTGVHTNLRLGGASREGAAFGGPQVYGDQRGNDRPGLPGNLYRDQFVLAHRILTNLDATQRELAVLDKEPAQTAIELQGPRGVFPGIAVSQLEPDNKALAHQLVDRILGTYPAADVAYARACLQANGGIERMSLSYYERGEDGAIAEGQVFRLEGPGAVLHFHGYPHVHAFVNVAMDGEAPLSAGEVVGENPAWLDGAGVQALFERALRVGTGADIGYYPDESIAGRLRPGVIRSGDIYSLESWQVDVEVVDIHGSSLAAPMVARLGGRPDPVRMYRVATTAYAAAARQDRLGPIASRRRGPLLRDLTVAHLKQHGFAGTTAT